MNNLETLLKEYADHVAERTAKGIPPLPLNAEQTNCVTKLLERESNYDSSYLLSFSNNCVTQFVCSAFKGKGGIPRAALSATWSS